MTLSDECGGVEVIRSAEEIPWSRIDAVLVCTPPSARGPVECAAARHGVAFFVEKPIAVHLDQCAPLLDALRDRPVINAVGYMNRYRESVRRARRALEGRTLLGVHAYWLAGRYQKPWWSVREQSGGPLNEQCTHFVDLARYFGGEVDEVAVTGSSPDAAEVVSIACRFASGACATILYSCVSQSKQMSFSMLCDDGVVELRGYDLAFDGVAQSTDEVWTSEMAAFCEAVERGRQDLIESNVYDALRTQRVMDAIIDSLATRRAEPIPVTISPSAI